MGKKILNLKSENLKAAFSLLRVCLRWRESALVLTRVRCRLLKNVGENFVGVWGNKQNRNVLGYPIDSMIYSF